MRPILILHRHEVESPGVFAQVLAERGGKRREALPSGRRVR